MKSAIVMVGLLVAGYHVALVGLAEVAWVSKLSIERHNQALAAVLAVAP